MIGISGGGCWCSTAGTVCVASSVIGISRAGGHLVDHGLDMASGLA